MSARIKSKILHAFCVPAHPVSSGSQWLAQGPLVVWLVVRLAPSGNTSAKDTSPIDKRDVSPLAVWCDVVGAVKRL